MPNSEKKPVKVGVLEGGGSPPGYCWGVEILDRAFEEAMTLLDPDQYDHMASQVRELARQHDPTHSYTIDIRPVEDFFELRDKGGILGRLNIRIFYIVHPSKHVIVILGTIKKENNGPTPLGDKVTIRRRKRLYLENYAPDL